MILNAVSRAAFYFAKVLYMVGKNRRENRKNLNTDYASAKAVNRFWYMFNGIYSFTTGNDFQTDFPDFPFCEVDVDTISFSGTITFYA